MLDFGGVSISTSWFLDLMAAKRVMLPNSQRLRSTWNWPIDKKPITLPTHRFSGRYFPGPSKRQEFLLDQDFCSLSPFPSNLPVCARLVTSLPHVFTPMLFWQSIFSAWILSTSSVPAFVAVSGIHQAFSACNVMHSLMNVYQKT